MDQYQIQMYREKLERSLAMTIRELAEECLGTPQPKPPVSEQRIQESEADLGRKLPDELRRIYATVGAISDASGASIVYPIDLTVSENIDIWSPAYQDSYMSMTSMFIFGGPGNGDRYFIRISASGAYLRGVYKWNHENDSRSWIANSIKDVILRMHSFGGLAE